MERLWSALGASEDHDVLTFTKSAPHSIQSQTAHTLIVNNCFCHDRSISEPAAIKIIWLWAWARNDCWRIKMSFSPRATCCDHCFKVYSFAVVDEVHKSSTWVKVQIRIKQYYSSTSTAFLILLEWKYKSIQFFMYLSQKVLIGRFIS